MKFSSASTGLAALLVSSTALALPQGQSEAQVANVKRTYPIPSSINCGAVISQSLSGLANVSPPDDTDLQKTANRLSKKGGTCTTPAGSGVCIRVACDDTTGIFMCNTDGHAGPYSADCAQVAKYVYGGETEGADTTIQDTFTQCRNPGLYSTGLVSGQAFDISGNWNVISGYASCKHPSTDGPSQQ